MNVTEVFEEAKRTIGSKGVFGTPYEKNGVTVIPAARIMGGAGGGEGPAAQAGDGSTESGDATIATGSGAGFGVSGHPTGAFVIKGDEVRWVPAVDVNRLMFGFQSCGRLPVCDPIDCQVACGVCRQACNGGCQGLTVARRVFQTRGADGHAARLRDHRARRARENGLAALRN